MTDVKITRAHELGCEQAKKVVQQLVDKLISRFGGKSSSQGNCVSYSHAGGVNGRIKCGEDEIVVNVSLTFMMSTLRGVIEAEINESLDKYLM